MEKQKLLYQQARLHNRGAAEMVLQTISASKGRMYPTFYLYKLILFIFESNSTGKQMLDYSEGFAEKRASSSRVTLGTDDLPMT